MQPSIFYDVGRHGHYLTLLRPEIMHFTSEVSSEALHHHKDTAGMNEQVKKSWGSVSDYLASITTAEADYFV